MTFLLWEAIQARVIRRLTNSCTPATHRSRGAATATRALLGTVICTVLLSCATPSSPTPTAQDTAVALRLIEAPPDQWREAMQAVRSLGPVASPALQVALEDPAADAPVGRRAAVGLLGLYPGDDVTACLVREIEDARLGAAEAALALGARGASAQRPFLVAVLGDTARTTEVRTAAACSLLELGDLEHAVPYLVALWTVATPAGVNRAQQHGLPAERVRWAHEREMARVAIANAFDGETFGLDPDSSWPAMAAATERFERAARARMAK